MQGAGRPAPEGLPCYKGPVQEAPDDKGPPSSVPKPAQKESDEDVGQLPRWAPPVASQRDVDILAQEAGQGHMPAAPELGDGVGAVRRIEVAGELDPEEPRQTDGHVR